MELKSKYGTAIIYNDEVEQVAISQIINLLNQEMAKDAHIRIMPYGAVLYDIKGLSATSFDYCIQDNSYNDDIRSLIYQGDRHLYTSWNSKASTVF